MSGSCTLVIGVLLPDVLGTYADAGNAVVLAQRARWRGIDARIHNITADTAAPPTGCDLYVIGGGEDAAQHFAAQWLSRHRQLRHALDTTATTLAVCAGLQILGEAITDTTGARHPGLGLLDLSTTPGRRRTVGEVVTRCDLPGVGLLTGFENHRGATTLGADTAALGRVLHGVGNGAGAPLEGAVTDRVIATYLHGPVLARNPALADLLLTRATGSPLGNGEHDLDERAGQLDMPDLAALRRTYLTGHQRR